MRDIYNNFTIRNIYILLKNIIKYIYINNRRLLNYKFYLSEYLNIIKWTDFCVEIKKLITYFDYIRFHNTLIRVDQSLEVFNCITGIIRESTTRALNMLGEHFSIISHGMRGEPDVALIIEVDRRYMNETSRAYVRGLARVIAALHRNNAFRGYWGLDDYDFTELRRMEDELISINPNYTRIQDRLWLEYVELVRVWMRKGFSESTFDSNNYIRIIVYNDGTTGFIKVFF